MLIPSVLQAGLNLPELTDHQCFDNIKINKSSQYKIIVKDKFINNLKPSFFSFNIEWVGFQYSHWDSKNKIVNADVIDFLNNDFKGAIYRYPGGTVSNHFNWKFSTGKVGNRTKQKAVNWSDPLTTEFGFNEYLKFLDSVNGIPWLVTNLHGGFSTEYDIEQLADLAFDWVKETNNLNVKILRWELGNELDRGKYKWTFSKYSQRANIIKKSIKRSKPTAKYVLFLRDFDVEGEKSSYSYNRNLIKKDNDALSEFALHQYYDQPNGGPSVKNRLQYLCSCVEEVEKQKRDSPSIWVTEHARAPVKITKKGWKDDYKKTYDLQSALSVADYLTGLSKISGVKGAFIHSLSSSNGPWSLFHVNNKKVKPSLVYWSIKLLRNDFMPNVLETDIESLNNSSYLGGYDFRASVFTNRDYKKYKIWMVNRSSSKIEVRLKIPKLASKKVKAKITSLYSERLTDNNKSSYREIKPKQEYIILEFDKYGETVTYNNKYAVTTILIEDEFY